PAPGPPRVPPPGLLEGSEGTAALVRGIREVSHQAGGLMKSPKNLLGIPKRSSGKDLGYQKNQNLVVAHEFAGQNPRVTRVKTDGRIGSATPHSELRGGYTVDNNKKAGPAS